jgi:hypothetical protein
MLSPEAMRAQGVSEDEILPYDSAVENLENQFPDVFEEANGLILLLRCLLFLTSRMTSLPLLLVSLGFSTGLAFLLR